MKPGSSLQPSPSDTWQRLQRKTAILRLGQWGNRMHSNDLSVSASLQKRTHRNQNQHCSALSCRRNLAVSCIQTQKAFTTSKYILNPTHHKIMIWFGQHTVQTHSFLQQLLQAVGPDVLSLPPCLNTGPHSHYSPNNTQSLRPPSSRMRALWADNMDKIQLSILKKKPQISKLPILTQRVKEMIWMFITDVHSPQYQ